jgi:rubredoxin
MNRGEKEGYCNGLLWRADMAHYAPFLKARLGIMSDTEFKSWVCIICGWVYDEEAGAPDEGIAPGTRWEDVPEYWVCPDCGAGKEDFEMVEI